MKPAVVGHSFGGLLAQILAGRGLASATVAIDPAPFRGVLPLPFSALKSAAPVIGNPANRGRAIPLTYDQFRYAFANAVSEDEADVVILAGAPLDGLATRVRHRIPVPLVEQMIAAVRRAEIPQRICPDRSAPIRYPAPSRV